MTDESALLAAIAANPDDDTTALALSDWLQENGAISLGLALQAAVKLRRDPTVYLASAGEYSDYSVYGVFSSEENARKWIEAHNDDFQDWRDPERRVLDAGIDRIAMGLKPYTVHMDRDGDKATATPASAYFSESDHDPGVLFGIEKIRYRTNCWARDENHAIKIANDRRIKLLAQGEK